MPVRTSQAGLAAATVAGGIDLNKTRIHDLLTGHPAAIPRSGQYPRCGENHGEPGFRQLPVADGTGWTGIVDIADVCGALLGPSPA